MLAVVYMIIKYISMGWLITNIPEMYRQLMTFKNRKRLIDWLDLVSCMKCTSFWVTLAMTGDPFIAAMVSMLSHIIDNKINTTTL